MPRLVQQPPISLSTSSLLSLASSSSSSGFGICSREQIQLILPVSASLPHLSSLSSAPPPSSVLCCVSFSSCHLLLVSPSGFVWVDDYAWGTKYKYKYLPGRNNSCDIIFDDIIIINRKFSVTELQYNTKAKLYEISSHPRSSAHSAQLFNNILVYQHIRARGGAFHLRLPSVTTKTTNDQRRHQPRRESPALAVVVPVPSVLHSSCFQQQPSGLAS